LNFPADGADQLHTDIADYLTLSAFSAGYRINFQNESLPDFFSSLKSENQVKEDLPFLFYGSIQKQD
jgi:hypothetical protein